MFLRTGKEFWYVAGTPSGHCLLACSFAWASLMFVCTDYHMGWSCLPKWDEVKDIRQEL